jgi:hypothetical protein
VNKNEVPGTYAVQGLRHHLDTLRVLPNGSYERTLRSKAAGHVLFRNRSTWTYAGSRLILHDYLLDEDEDLGPKTMSDLGAMTCDLPVEKRLNKIVIYYREDGNDSFYYKKL